MQHVENENAGILRVIIVLDRKKTTSILLGFSRVGHRVVRILCCWILHSLPLVFLQRSIILMKSKRVHVTLFYTLLFAGRKCQIDLWCFLTKRNIMAIMTIFFKLLHNVFCPIIWLVIVFVGTACLLEILKDLKCWEITVHP